MTATGNDHDLDLELDVDVDHGEDGEDGDELVTRLRALAPALGGGGAARGEPAGGDDVAIAFGGALDRFRRAAEREELVDVAYATVPSPVGELVVVGTERGIVALNWELGVLDVVAEKVSPRVLHAPGRLDGARRQLDEYFEHRRDHFELPIDWSLTAGFRRLVLQALSDQVPYGHLTTYGQLAELVGSPKAGRAVGSAMATNPIPIIVPCHRVLQSGGGLGGYSGRDGVVTKRFLLSLEGAELPGRSRPLF